LLEDRTGLLRAAGGPRLLADVGADLRQLLVEQGAHEVTAHDPAVLEPDAMADPLPDLRARDLRGRGVLHEVVDAGGATSSEPERDVLEADAEVVAQTGL